ncbi:MAG TPA: hypothetical protein VLB69_13680 [Rudaea sp.]|nr:hypothetical protein [Rudaea sp.]
MINPTDHPFLAVVSSFTAPAFFRTFEKERPLLPAMPLILSISSFLISGIGSPRRGLIHVRPANLDALATSLHAPR